MLVFVQSTALVHNQKATLWVSKSIIKLYTLEIGTNKNKSRYHIKNDENIVIMVCYEKMYIWWFIEIYKIDIVADFFPFDQFIYS